MIIDYVMLFLVSCICLYGVSIGARCFVYSIQTKEFKFAVLFSIGTVALFYAVCLMLSCIF